MAMKTTKQFRHHILTPKGVPTLIVTDADPGFTSKCWKQTQKSMRIDHIMASPDHDQTKGQAERKITELQTALRNLTNLH